MDNTLDRRVVRTRKLLQDALFKLILKKGYDSIRIRDITDESNLGRATFYIHYKDKEDLLLATIERTRQDLQERIQAESASSSLPGFRVQFHHAAENSLIYKAILNRVQGRQQIQSVMVDAVQSNLEKTIPDSSVPLDAVANFLVGAVVQLLDWWLTNNMPYSVDEMETVFLK